METVLIKDYMSKATLSLFSKLTYTGEDRSYHAHDFYEIFYILKGSITHNANNRDKTVLSAGDAVLLRKSDKHCFIRDKGPDCVHRDIIISEEQFKKACDFIDENLLNSIQTQSGPLHAAISPAKIAEFENFFTDLDDEETGSRKTSMINILSVNLLNVFMQKIRKETDTYKYPQWFKDLLLRFKMPPLMQKGLDAILEQTNYDKSYVCRTFKKHMGCNMSQYLLAVRLDYAATLLQITNNTMVNICEQIGIDSYPYFTVSFKKKFGMTPKEFRLRRKETFFI